MPYSNALSGLNSALRTPQVDDKPRVFPGAFALASLTGGDPVIEYPSTLELGEQELGQVAVARFAIANRGGGELVLDQIQTNCACAGLEQEVDGYFVRIETLRLRRGDWAELVLRTSVRGQIAAPTRNTITFRTNDPTRPLARIEAVISKVTGDLFTVPTSVVFASVPVGSQARQVLEVRDTAVVARSIQQVESSHPERFSVRLLAPGDQVLGEEAQTTAGILLGLLEVVLHTHAPGLVEGAILIHLNDPSRPPQSVPVAGRVAALIEAHPPAVVLPRASNAGAVYWVDTICRSSEGKPLTLTLQEAPGGVSVTTSELGENPSLKKVRIEWQPNRQDPSASEGSHVLRFLGRIGDQDCLLDIPLHLHPAIRP